MKRILFGMLESCVRQTSGHLSGALRMGCITACIERRRRLSCPGGIGVVWALTGTPILSRPVQLFNILRLIRHPLARNFAAYAERYCAGGKTIYGVEASGASRPTELRAATASVTCA